MGKRKGEIAEYNLKDWKREDRAKRKERSIYKAPKKITASKEQAERANKRLRKILDTWQEEEPRLAEQNEDEEEIDDGELDENWWKDDDAREDSDLQERLASLENDDSLMHEESESEQEQLQAKDDELEYDSLTKDFTLSEQLEKKLKVVEKKIFDYPEIFVSKVSAQIDKELSILTKLLYDFAKTIEPLKKGSPLTQLIIDGFDKEQIWEELQLQNEPLLRFLDRKARYLVKRADTIDFGVTLDDSDDEDEGEEDIDDQNADDLDDPEEVESFVKPKKKATKTKSIDKNKELFFSEDVMEDWLELVEAEEDMMVRMERGEPLPEENLGEINEDDVDDEDEEVEEEIDVYQKVDGKSTYRYEDFFDSLERNDEEQEEFESGSKSARDAALFGDDEDLEEEENEDVEDDDDENEVEGMEDAEDEDNLDWDIPEINNREDELDEEDKGKDIPQLKKTLQLLQDEQPGKTSEVSTAFQKRMNKIKSEIDRLEELAIAEKPWIMRGEISSRQRPKNSLLEVALDFEHTAKPAPIITEEVTNDLEEMIKRRISEQSWDDVIRKKVIEKKERKEVELDQGKSKVGLAEVYEKEFMKQAFGLDEKQEKLDAKQQAVIGLYKKICYHLDRLANFHFTPKPDLEIKKADESVPAIQMEEALPVATSEASTLAPEEVYAKSRKEVKGETELTQEDRKKIRKDKKTIKKKINQEKESEKKLKQRINPDAAKPTKKEAEQDLKRNRSRNTIIASSSGGNAPTSSTELFKQLQQESEMGKAGKKTPKDQKEKKLNNAASLKL